MKSKAYVVSDHTITDKIGKKNKWLVMRATLCFLGEVNGGDMIFCMSRGLYFLINGMNPKMAAKQKLYL